MLVGDLGKGRLKEILDIIYEHGERERYHSDWITEKIREKFPDTFSNSVTPEQSINMYFSQNKLLFEWVGRKTYKLKTEYYKSSQFVDQFSVQLPSEEQAERRAISSYSYLRSVEVRRRVLNRAQGKCEWCDQPGFAMADGRVFLETHHVVPLSENGADADGNVIALCPNHHREAHFGAGRLEMRVAFQSKLSCRQSA